MNSSFSFVLIVASLACVYCSTSAPWVTGTPRPNIGYCPNSYCLGRNDGNHNYPGNQHTGQHIVGNPATNREMFKDYFVVCKDGKAKACMACAEANTFFADNCDQCLFASGFSNVGPNVPIYQACHTTLPTGTPRPRPNCPGPKDFFASQYCKEQGADFCGNRRDYRILTTDPTSIYIGCWMGQYVDCERCQNGLFFYELEKYGDRSIYDSWGFCERMSYGQSP